jgi:hypothetical protein
MFFACILSGLWNAEYFMQAVAPKILSYLFGLIGSIISGIIAFLIALFIPNRNEFMKQVFYLYHYDDFRMAITFIVFLFPIIRIISRIINRSIKSISARRTVSFILLVLNLSMICSLAYYLSMKATWQAYTFSFVVIAIFFLILNFEMKISAKPPRRHAYDWYVNNQNAFE